MSQKKTVSIFTNISNILMLLNKVNSIADSYSAISELVRNEIEVKKEYIFQKKSNKFIEINDTPYDDELLELINWSLKTKNISAFPEDNGSYLIIPVGNEFNIFFIYAAYTSSYEFSNQDITMFKIMSFLLANVYQNFILYDELKSKNAVIENNKNFLSSIINSNNDSIVVFNNSLSEEYANSNWKKIKNCEFLLLKIKEISASVLSLQTSISKEIKVENKYYYIECLPLNYLENKYIIINVRDITGSIELEKLKKVDKMKNEFLSMVSHELRTPLSGIKAYSETIVDSLDALDKNTLKEFLKTILSESTHLEKLLNDLLDFSKLEMKTLKLSKEEFDICNLLNNIVHSLNELAKTKNVKIDFLCKDLKINVFMDKTRIQQVITNIIQNAIKYSDETKKEKFVQIYVSEKENNVIIKIEDNGIGIEKEYQSRIFEKFYRVDSSLTYKTQGTGIGLSVANDLVNIHNGKITVESTLSIGSIFTINLPKGDKNAN